jgi:hypothetical protein
MCTFVVLSVLTRFQGAQNLLGGASFLRDTVMHVELIMPVNPPAAVDAPITRLLAIVRHGRRATEQEC